MLAGRRLWRATAAAVCAASLLAHAAPVGEMPPNTVLLSTMMQTLSERPGFTDEFLADLAGGGNKAALPLTPELRHDLREIVLGKNWQGLDHFPGWTMERLNPVVATAQKVIKPSGPAPTPAQTMATYLDLGPFGAMQPAGKDFASFPNQSVNLDQPSTLPGFTTDKIVVPLVDGVTSGDGPDPVTAPLHSESARLAFVLNRLSLNPPPPHDTGILQAFINGQGVTTPEDLMAKLIATGHHIEVDDSRYFANFGSFNWATPGGSKEVMMPFWLDSQLPIPNTKRTLLIPVAHAQYEWHISGPKINAAVSFWFGIDGKAEFRTMDQVEQRWVMGRHAHVYTGADAIEVTRLAGRILATYTRLHLAHPDLPFGGYYTFGVCQDVVAAIELHMTGTSTLFPNTADNTYFPENPPDPRDAEVNALFRRLPKDGHGKKPDFARIFGSLPLADTDAELAKVTIPGLAEDLIAVNDAQRGPSPATSPRKWIGFLGLIAAFAYLLFWRRFRRIRQRRAV